MTGARTPELLSAAEVSAATGAPVDAVHRTLERRLPAGVAVRRGQGHRLTRWEVVCFLVDRAVPRDVPLGVRRQLFAEILKLGSPAPVRCQRGLLCYEIDVRPIADQVEASLTQYRNALKLIAEDDSVFGGAATFRGTRILVHQVAALLEQGATELELRDDHPDITAEMIAAAPIYARAHPRRGRPRKPAWRRAETYLALAETSRRSGA